MELHACCFSFGQQASVSYPGVSAREFRLSFRILKLPIVLSCPEYVRHAPVMTYTSSLFMHCTGHFLLVPVGGVGLSGAGLCSYLSFCPACAYGCAFHLACLVVSVGLLLQQPVSHGGFHLFSLWLWRSCISLCLVRWLPTSPRLVSLFVSIFFAGVLMGAQSSPLFRLWHSGVTTLSPVSWPVAFVSTFGWFAKQCFNSVSAPHVFSFRQKASVSSPGCVCP